jgi:hypothetical protein
LPGQKLDRPVPTLEKARTKTGKGQRLLENARKKTRRIGQKTPG